MYNYNAKKLLELIEEIFSHNFKAEEIQWLCDKSYNFATSGNTTAFLSAFTAAPRYTGKRLLDISDAQQAQVNTIRKNASFQNYTSSQLARIWLLLHFPTENEEHYVDAINMLFNSAEMNELVALYSSLPFLAFPDRWKFRCTEGIRSNIGTVLESIICNNPYPSEYLDEAAWNQLVLKAFFTDKPVNEIVGLDDRANSQLSETLIDYAHERWAAGREINPLLWRLVGPFITESSLHNIQRLFNSNNETERQAAALACLQSEYPPARELLKSYPELRSAIESGQLTWQVLTQKAVFNY